MSSHVPQAYSTCWAVMNAFAASYEYSQATKGQGVWQAGREWVFSLSSFFSHRLYLHIPEPILKPMPVLC